MHHTGIKTCTGARFPSFEGNFNCTIQELKQEVLFCRAGAVDYFNCTIQELKPKKRINIETCELYFNCTIQELKHIAAHFIHISSGFQLHHTGIKTGNAGLGDQYLVIISIAPYRN